MALALVLTHIYFSDRQCALKLTICQEDKEHIQVFGRRDEHFDTSVLCRGQQAGDAVNMQNRKIVGCSPNIRHSAVHEIDRPLGCACECSSIKRFSALRYTLPMVMENGVVLANNPPAIHDDLPKIEAADHGGMDKAHVGTKYHGQLPLCQFRVVSMF